MCTYFEMLEKIIPDFLNHVTTSSHEKFFINEALRFYSIAGTIKASFHNIDNSIDERIMTHILARSIIENYFRLLYVFDDPNQSASRFNECLNDFKKNYLKLYNEPHLPQKSQLHQPDPAWSQLPNQKDLNSMMAALKNDYGDRFNYLYVIYRVSSLDTHGNSLECFFDATFQQKCNIPYLKLDKAFNLIANQYLIIWSTISPNQRPLTSCSSSLTSFAGRSCPCKFVIFIRKILSQICKRQPAA